MRARPGVPEYAGQRGFDVRCAWGSHGVAALRDGCDVLVIVDALSFTTSMEICESRGAVVHSLRLRDETAADEVHLRRLPPRPPCSVTPGKACTTAC